MIVANNEFQILMEQKGLSPAEARVADFMCRGFPQVKVGELLFITEKTVKFHCTAIYRKLGLKSRSELSAKYSRFHPDVLLAEQAAKELPPEEQTELYHTGDGLPRGL